MQDAEFSDEFCGFLQRCVPDVDACELLLAVAQHPQLEWSAQALLERKPASVSITEAEAASTLAFFRAQGVLPPGTADREHLATLARAYNERPVTLFRMIYALRDAKIHSFADAFRLRKR